VDGVIILGGKGKGEGCLQHGVCGRALQKVTSVHGETQRGCSSDDEGRWRSTGTLATWYDGTCEYSMDLIRCAHGMGDGGLSWKRRNASCSVFCAKLKCMRYITAYLYTAMSMCVWCSPCDDCGGWSWCFVLCFLLVAETDPADGRSCGGLMMDKVGGSSQRGARPVSSITSAVCCTQ